MNKPETALNLRHPCKHLRSKEMFYQNASEETDEFSSGVFWCLKTHEGFGPDGQTVGKSECCQGRSCFGS